MAEDKKKTIKEFADEIRQQVDVPEGMDDATLVRKIIEVRPEVLQHLQTSTPRRQLKPEGGAVGRFFSGIGEGTKDIAKGVARFPLSMLESFDPNRTGDTMHQLDEATKGMSKPDKYKAAEDQLKQLELGQVPGAQGISNRLSKGDTAGAVGYAVPNAVAVTMGLKGGVKSLGKGKAAASTSALDESLAMGAETIPDKAARALSKGVAAEHNAILDSQISNIDQSMGKEVVNVQQLRVSLAKATNAIERAEKAVNTQVKDFSAAKDVVEQMSQRLNPVAKTTGGQSVSKVTAKVTWPELRQWMKQLNAARQQIADPGLKNQLTHMTDSMMVELQKVADKAGQGPQFKKWTEDYAQLSELQRKYAAALRGKTEPQLIKKQTVKDAKVKVLGTQIGGSSKNKIAGFNKKHIDNFHKAFDQLKTKIQTQPKVPPKPPQPLPPSQTPPSQPNPNMSHTMGGAGGVLPIQVGPPTPPPQSMSVPKGPGASPGPASAQVMQELQKFIQTKIPPPKPAGEI